MQKYCFSSPLLASLLMTLSLGCASLVEEDKPRLSDTQRARIRLNIAKGALVQEDFTGALIELKKVDQIKDNLPETHHMRALAFFGKKELALALDSAKRAFRLASDRPSIQTTYGKLLMDTGDLTQAERVLTPASKNQLFREAFKATTNLGIISYRRGRYDNARRRFETAVNQNTKNACVAHYYLGHLHLREASFEEALKSYQLAAKNLCGSFAQAHFAMGVAYSRWRRYDEARKKFLEVRKLYPNSKLADMALERIRQLP